METGIVKRGMEMLMWPWMASCHETEESLSDHLEGELPPRRERRVLRHLARCERCQEVLESFRRTVEQLRALGKPDVVEPDPALADVVVERIRRESG
jgi:anti-sigma factor RsiW